MVLEARAISRFHALCFSRGSRSPRSREDYGNPGKRTRSAQLAKALRELTISNRTFHRRVQDWRQHGMANAI
jgi:hypothetical protein